MKIYDNFTKKILHARNQLKNKLKIEYSILKKYDKKYFSSLDFRSKKSFLKKI
jgi:hypothetical protein